MNIIVGNYGNGTIALMQWAHQQQLPHVTVLYVDTGWSAARWQPRVTAGQAFAKACGFAAETLPASIDFFSLMQQRQAFPTSTQQWCAGILKGLPLLDWLDQQDPTCEATILIGKTRFSSRINQVLSEYVTDSDYYDGRTLRHPLVHETKTSFEALIQQAGFAVLPHRSLECEPCINATEADFQRMALEDVEKLTTLEQILGKPMFSCPIAETVATAKAQQHPDTERYLEKFDQGCSSPFGCGL